MACFPSLIIRMKLNTVPFHEKDYWKDRFDKENHFEWLFHWDTIKESVIPYLNKEPILHLGCGNSTLAFDMWDSHYEHIVNVDYAENVIDRMKYLTQLKESDTKNDYSGITWHVGDCLDGLSSYVPHPEYGVVIEKSLTDAIACGDNDDQTKIRTLSEQILSVTQPMGIWISITFSSTRQYIWNTQNYTWKSINTIPIQGEHNPDTPYAPTIYYYIHILQKVPCSTL